MAEPARTLASAQAAADRAQWAQVTELTAALEPTTRKDRVALAFLRARAALHADLPAAALAALDGLAAVEGRPDELATRDVLRGRALVALGRNADAIALLEAVAAGAQGALLAQAQLAWAQALVQADRFGQAEPILDALLAADPPGTTAAHALAVYGRLEIRRGRRPIAARYLRDALEALGPHEREPELRLWLQGALLDVAIATLDLRLVLWVRAELAAGEATSPPLSAAARRLHEQLAFGTLLLGELEAAWAIVWAVRERAPAGVPAIAADLLGAQIARAAGETFTPVQLLARAAAQAQQVAWNETGPAGRQVLLTATELAATAGLPGAAALLDIYDGLPALDPVARGGEDARDLAPREAMARAAIAGAGGQRELHIHAVRRAIAQWRALGDELGELRAVLALASATYDSDALERAATLTALIPRSWLRRRYELLAERARGPEQLSPAERRVMHAICQGSSSKQIAADFGRSKHTIRNQTRRLYQVMRVGTRSELVAKCAAMGILPTAR